MTLSPVFIHLVFHNPCFPLSNSSPEGKDGGKKREKKNNKFWQYIHSLVPKMDKNSEEVQLHKRELFSIQLSMNYHHEKDRV